MKKKEKTKKLVIAAFFISALCVQAGEIKLNFLEQASVFEEASKLLKDNGVSQETLTTFKRLVDWQNQGGNGVDRKAFPPSTNGWFYFNGISDLSNRLSCLMARTPGKPTFVCFDVATMFLWSAGGRAERLYDDFESKGILEVTSERKVSSAKRPSFSTGIHQIAPPEGYYQLVGKRRSDSETKLALSLRAARTLPIGIKEDEQGMHAAFAELVKGVKNDGFIFPKEHQIGMVLYVDMKRGFIKGDHAFICIPKSPRWITIEKASSTGPFVMGEFVSEADLAEYTNMAERRDTEDPKDVDYGSTVIVSLNERVIGVFQPKGKQ